MSSASSQNPLEHRFVLPNDVQILPVAELAQHVRAQLGSKAGGFIVIRPGTRAPSRLVDDEMADLLGRFREPTSVLDAAQAFALQHRLDERTVLASASAALQAFVSSMILVPEESTLSESVAATFSPGQAVGPYEVVRAVQVLADSEVYEARSAETELRVALKVGRPESSPEIRLMLAREEAVLKLLAGESAPRILDAGPRGERPWLALEWLPGRSVLSRANALRTEANPEWRQHLHRLGGRLIAAYTSLHERAVLHGDVHARNALAGDEGQVRLLDFGLASIVGAGPPLEHPQRAGLGWNTEPEALEELRRTGALPAMTLLGEQYAVAVLVYSLLCGRHPAGDPVKREELYEQVLGAEVRSFAEQGFEPWPDVEAILGRALSKDPARRFASMRAFGDAFRRARPPRFERAHARRAVLAPLRSALDSVIEPLLSTERTSISEQKEHSSSSISDGGAGVATFLYRASVARECPRLLAAADHWSRLAVARESVECAMLEPEREESREQIREPGTALPAQRSIYGGRPGALAVQTLVASARGDLIAAEDCIERFSSAITRVGSGTPLDNQSGGLLVGSILVELVRHNSRLEAPRLEEAVRTLQRVALRSAWTELEHAGAVRGLAQSSAGGLYALLFSTFVLERSPRDDLPEDLRVVLAQAGEQALDHGHGAHRTRSGNAADAGNSPTPDDPGWSSGSAGYVHLWALAYALTGDPQHRHLAERFAGHCWEHADNRGDLCSGLSGRAYALLRLFQATGDSTWLERAHDLAERARPWVSATLKSSPSIPSLFQGVLGPLLLALELDHPERAAHPFFASECLHQN